MADDDILAQFKEFMESKTAAEKEASDAEEEVEIWDGQKGARVKKSVAEPFLKSLGLIPDEVPDEPDGKSDDGAAKPGKRKSGNAPGPQSQSVTRKYFKPAGK